MSITNIHSIETVNICYNDFAWYTVPSSVIRG